MHTADYSYRFGDFRDRQNLVEARIERTHEKRIFAVAINDLALLESSSSSMPPELADLLDIAVAVYVADRMSLRGRDRQCSIAITLPLRDHTRFASLQIIERLEKILYWYTGDKWSFEFEQRKSYGRLAERQPHFPFRSTKPTEVALWSGGLNSYAGLINRWLLYPENRFVLVGTGANSNVIGLQKRVERLATSLDNNIELKPIPLRLTYGHVYRPWDINRIPRVRGLVFMLIGAVCALLEDRTELSIYENGLGAINLSFGAYSLGLDHSRAVHPISLLDVSNLITKTVGQCFTIHNPFLFSTKAQMCAVFNRLPEHLRYNAVDVIFSTSSCDRQNHHKPRQYKQHCGWCSSCLLRHQALCASGIGDNTEYDIAPLSAPIPSRSHFWAMGQQVDKLREVLSAHNPWYALSREYPETLPDMVSRLSEAEGLDTHVIINRLVDLYRNYVNEWDRVLSITVPHLQNKDLYEHNIA